MQEDGNCTRTRKDREEMQGRVRRKSREGPGGNDREGNCRIESCSSTSQAKDNHPTGGGRSGLDCTETSEPHALFASLIAQCVQYVPGNTAIPVDHEGIVRALYGPCGAMGTEPGF